MVWWSRSYDNNCDDSDGGCNCDDDWGHDDVGGDDDIDRRGICGDDVDSGVEDRVWEQLPVIENLTSRSQD